MQADWQEKDLYAVLSVAQDADAKAIGRAYRRLARQLHPDTHPDDAAATERFKEVTAAYDVIGDPVKRAEYDEFRAALANAQAQRRDRGRSEDGGPTGPRSTARATPSTTAPDGGCSTGPKLMGSARTTLTASSAVSWDVAVDRARPLGPARTWKRSWTSRSRMRYAAWRPSSASTGRMGRGPSR